MVRPGGQPELEDRVVRDLPDLLRPGDALVVNDTQGDPGAAVRAAASARRTEAGDRGDADRAPRRLALARLRASRRKKLQPGDVVRFGDEGKVCFLGQLDATVEEKGEGGEVTLAFSLSRRRCSTRRIAERGDMPLPPYIASRRAPDEQDRDRLPDPVRARGGLGRGADRRPAFHRRTAGAACRARRRRAQGDAACRRRARSCR